MIFGAPLGRQCPAVKVSVVEKVDAVNDYALLACRFAPQHLFSLDDARVFLN
jgi:hypothetical protein